MTNPNTPVHRILMSADGVGGVWTFSIELAKALAPYGIEVVIASMGGPLKADQQAEALRLPNVMLFQSAYKLEWMENPWEEVEKAGQWLLELEADMCPDLVHLNGFCHASLPWHSPQLVVGHSCVFSWFRAVRGCEPSEKWHRYHKETMAGLRAAKGVTAPTGAMLRSLWDTYGPFISYGAIYNGRDPAVFPPAKEEPFILSAGRLWDEAKNTAVLETAAGRLPWPVYMAGETTHPDGGTRVLENVIHLGQLTHRELAQWFGRASIYVLPARYEPFGLTALEAALAGCSLVLGDIPTLREVWADAALYVHPDDPKMLRELLSDLILHRGKRDLLSRKARERALRFTPERMARGYVRVYESMLRRNQRLLRRSGGSRMFAQRAHLPAEKGVSP